MGFSMSAKERNYSMLIWNYSVAVMCLLYRSPMLQDRITNITLLGTNISPKNGILKMIFLFPRWHMLVPWRVIRKHVKFKLLFHAPKWLRQILCGLMCWNRTFRKLSWNWISVFQVANPDSISWEGKTYENVWTKQKDITSTRLSSQTCTWIGIEPFGAQCLGFSALV